jgi:hypothetical protein
MPDTAAPARHANGRFGPGNPGRRAGARNQVSHRLVMAMLEDFELHRKVLVDSIRRNYPTAYFAIMTRLLDRQLLPVDGPMEDEDPGDQARQLAAPGPQAPGPSEDPRAVEERRAVEDPRAALDRIQRTLARMASANKAASGYRINGN